MLTQSVGPLHVMNFSGRELDVTINNIEQSRSILKPGGGLTWAQMESNVLVRIHEADKTEALSRVVFDGTAIVATIVNGKPTLISLSRLKEPGMRYELGTTRLSPYSTPEAGTATEVLPAWTNLPAHVGTRFTTDWDKMRELWQRSRLQYSILNQANHPEKTRDSAFAPDLNFRIKDISTSYEVPLGLLNNVRREGTINFEHNATVSTPATSITLSLAFRYPINENTWASSTIVVNTPKEVWTLAALFDDSTGNGMTVTNVDTVPITLNLSTINNIALIEKSFSRASLSFAPTAPYRPELIGNPAVYPTAQQRFFTLNGLDTVAKLITPKSTAISLPPMSSIRIINPTGVPLTVNEKRFRDGGRMILNTREVNFLDEWR